MSGEFEPACNLKNSDVIGLVTLVGNFVTMVILVASASSILRRMGQIMERAGYPMWMNDEEVFRRHRV
jgi:hypothetical protein